MQACCSGNHSSVHSGTNATDCIYVPGHHRTHMPLGSVPISEVEDLIRRGILAPCDYKRIYALRGKFVAFICSDPSLRHHKLRLLDGRGEPVVFSDLGYGLRFDPDGPFKAGVARRIEKARNSLDELRQHNFTIDAVVFGAHGPCGAAKGRSLEFICRSVFAGAKYFGEQLEIETIPTIFVNALIQPSELLPPISMLLWMDILKGE